MKVSVLKEIHPGERRVAGSPATVSKLRKLGFEVAIERGAGVASSYPDEQYEEAGATLSSRAEAIAAADIVMKVRQPTLDEVSELREGSTLISFLWPAQNRSWWTRSPRAASPRSRWTAFHASVAPQVDSLSSMANIAGYRAVLEAAHHFGSFFTGQFTAAGRVAPATVLVIGAGVAGLAAIARPKGSARSSRRSTPARPWPIRSRVPEASSCSSSSRSRARVAAATPR